MNTEQFLILNQNLRNKYYFSHTTIEEMIIIKEFEEELKIIFFKFNLFIERHLKSILIYEYNKLYTNKDYLDTRLYNKNFKEQVNKVFSIFNTITAKYDNIKTFEKITEYLTFGQSIFLIDIMNDSIKNDITRHFSNLLKDNINNNVILNFNTLRSYLNNIKELRNAVSHDNKLFYFKVNNNKYLKELHSLYNISKTEPRQDISNIIITYNCFLTPCQLKTLTKELNKSIRKFKDNINNNDIFFKVINSLSIDKLEIYK